MRYSSEFGAALAMFFSPVLGQYLSDACAGEVAAWIGSLIVSALSGGYLLFKRWLDGKTGKKKEVNLAGFYVK